MRIGCIGWWDGPNVGDDLAVDLLERALGRHFPELAFTRITPHHLLTTAPNTVTISELFNAGVSLADLYDAVLLGPGGLLPWLATDTLPDEWWADVPLFGVGLGWASSTLHEEAHRARAKHFLRRVSWLWARDAVMAGIAIEAHVETELAPDIVYSLEPGGFATGHGSKRVVVCPNATQGAAAEQGFAWLLDWLVETGYHSQLLAASAVCGQLDALVCERLARPGVQWEPRILNWREAVEMIRGACAVYSARKHPAVMAELFGTPCWMLDVMGALRPLHDCAHGYGRVVGGLGDIGNPFTDWAVTPRALARDVPRTWAGQLTENRERVAGALDSLLQNLEGMG